MTQARRLLASVLGGLLLTQTLVGGALWLPLARLGLAHDPDQGSRLEAAWLWLGLLVFLMVLTPCRRLLAPVMELLDRSLLTVDQASTLRLLLRSLPRRLSVRLILGNLNAYLIGSVTLRFSADLPWTECLKVAILGIPTGLLGAVLAYFLLSLTTGRLLEGLPVLDPPVSGEVPVRLLWKTRACLLVVGVVPLVVTLLICYASSQRQLERHLIHLGDMRLRNWSHQIQAGHSWSPGPDLSGRESSALTDRHGRIRYFQGSEEDRPQFQDDLMRLRTSHGEVVLRDRATRVMVWRSMGEDVRLIICLPLSDYQEELDDSLQGTLVAGALTLLLALGLGWALGGHLVVPVARLTRLARDVPQGAWPRRMPDTDDEIGLLGQTLARMLGELKSAQEWAQEANRQLGQVLAERTLKMQQLSTLFSVSRSMSANLDSALVSEELLMHVQGIMAGAPCSLLLEGHGGLRLSLALGLSAEVHPDPDRFALHDRTEFLKEGEEGFPAELSALGYQGVLQVPVASPQGPPQGLLLIFGGSDRPSKAHIDTLRRVAQYAGAALENARLYQERDQVARLLQRALIPEQLAFPCIQVGHCFAASKLLSGDYYDLIPLDTQRFALVMVDVAGKGTEAAIQTVRARHAIRAYAVAGYGPAGVLQMLNRLISEDPEGRMATAFYAEYELDDRLLRYSSAGHEPPLLWRPGSAQVELLEPTDLVLGAVDQLEPEEHCCHVDTGSRLLLFTDGVSEARSPQGEFLGSGVLLELERLYRDRSPQELVQAIFDRVQEFTAGHLSDDLSLLAVSFP